MRDAVLRALRWLVGVLHDPTTDNASSARLCALVCCAAGVTVALKYRDAATVAACIGGGTVALLSRAKGGE